MPEEEMALEDCRPKLTETAEKARITNRKVVHATL
jgi:hypothetical protein